MGIVARVHIHRRPARTFGLHGIQSAVGDYIPVCQRGAGVDFAIRICGQVVVNRFINARRLVIRLNAGEVHAFLNSMAGG